jgi:hypothetical protein
VSLVNPCFQPCVAATLLYDACFNEAITIPCNGIRYMMFDAATSIHSKTSVCPVKLRKCSANADTVQMLTLETEVAQSSADM